MRGRRTGMKQRVKALKGEKQFRDNAAEPMGGPVPSHALTPEKKWQKSQTNS